VARAFVEAGASMLGVSTVEEGKELRSAGILAPILVLGGVFPGEEADVMAAAVWSIERARALANTAQAAGRTIALHVKIDTGMTRLGIDVADAHAFGQALRTIPGLRVAGIFSHFASADAVDTAAARAQAERFRGAVDALASVGVSSPLIHLANSAAVLSAPAVHCTMVRPGIMLYGYAPASHLAARAALRPAMRLRTAVAQARRVPVGTAVGYAGTFVASRP